MSQELRLVSFGLSEAHGQRTLVIQGKVAGMNVTCWREH